jgi:hypothetical protein
MKHLLHLVAALSLLPCVPAWSREKAPDPLHPGANPVSVAEYHSEAAIYPDVSATRETEFWARVYWPSGLASGPYPLIMLLHGNHASCGVIGTSPRVDKTSEYGLTGKCPEGSVVVANHAGYEYLGRHLASWGYVVVSVNANRGINALTDDNDANWSNNYTRGRLLLAHLRYLSQWNAGTQPLPDSLGLGPEGFKGKLDFQHVGFFGHSRGGEGVRVAHTLYKSKVEGWREAIPGMRVRGIFEIGATDWQTDVSWDADGASWTQLLPMCDGDVKNLEGRRPFDRMVKDKREIFSAMKALVQVWGANHNAFNTEWQQHDSTTCPGGQRAIFDPNVVGSATQRKVGVAFVSAFFRSQVGAEKELARVFNPLYDLPDSITGLAKVQRDFSLTPNVEVSRRFESFSKKGLRNSVRGSQNEASGLDKVAHLRLAETQLPVGMVSWSKSGSATFLQLNWTPPGEGKDVSALRTLDFRVAPKVGAPAFDQPVDFSLALVDSAGTVSSPVSAAEWVEILPLPKPRVQTFQTVRIPLALFSGVDLTKLRGVRITFDRTGSGQLLFAQFRLGARDE